MSTVSAVPSRSPWRLFAAAKAAIAGAITALVLMTGGGNDVRFASIVQQCFAPVYRDPGRPPFPVPFRRQALHAGRLGWTGGNAYGKAR